MLYIRCSTRFLASTFVLALGAACNKADEGGDSKTEADSPAIAAAEDQPLAGHEFLRLKDVPDGLLMDHFDLHGIELALDPVEYYYLGVGPRVLVVDRSQAKAFLRVIEFPSSLALLGIREQEMILHGKDPTRCTAERPKLGMPSPACASVYRRSTDEGEVQLVGALDADEAVLVGDHVAALVDDSTLVTLPLAGGEPRRVGFEGSGDGELRVQGNRLLWTALAGEGSAQKSRVYRSQAPFAEVELVFELEKPLEAEAISDVAWIGDGIAYLVAAPKSNLDVEQKLYRRIGEQTELLLTGLTDIEDLVHDSGAAWLVESRQGVQGLWRISPKEHRRVTFATPPQFVTGTRSGLAWIEERDGMASFHLTGMGPANLEAPEVPAELVSLPPKPSEGLAGGSASEPAAKVEPTVDGDLGVDVVRRIIRAHHTDVRACSEAAVKKNPELAGQLTVAFVIAKTGKVGKAEVVGEPFDAELGKCVTKAVRGWTFPKPGDGEPVDVSYPFAFPLL